MAGETGERLSEFDGFAQMGKWGLIDRHNASDFVFDYEIWLGRPGRGTLLTKQSAFSTDVGDSDEKPRTPSSETEPQSAIDKE
jgi:hypothetical protein